VEYARQGAIPGGLKNNREFVSCAVRVEGAIAPEVEDLLYDPQTSGGLLISVGRDDAEGLVEDLRAQGVVAGGVWGGLGEGGGRQGGGGGVMWGGRVGGEGVVGDWGAEGGGAGGIGEVREEEGVRIVVR